MVQEKEEEFRNEHGMRGRPRDGRRICAVVSKVGMPSRGGFGEMERVAVLVYLTKFSNFRSCVSYQTLFFDGG